MIGLQLVIKYYMLSFLLIDSVSGFIRVYLDISNPIFNIGYWIRTYIIIIYLFLFNKIF